MHVEDAVIVALSVAALRHWRRLGSGERDAHAALRRTD